MPYMPVTTCNASDAGQCRASSRQQANRIIHERNLTLQIAQRNGSFIGTAIATAQAMAGAMAAEVAVAEFITIGAL